MRKEVKQGLAIGGVLLSVLIVYLLATSGSTEKPQQAALVTTDSGSPDKPATAPSPVAEAPKPDSKPADEPKKDADAKPAVADKNDPFKAVTTTEEPWAHGVLQSGELPVMLTTTPQKQTSVTPIAASTSGAEANQPITPAAAPANGTPAGGISNTPQSVTPTTRPNQRASTPASPRTHTVQPGETFSSIAAAAYGNAAYYGHLIRANPNVTDPHKLRPGMVITLPPVSEVKGDDAPMTLSASTPGGGASKIDSKTQYVVQSGDTLSRIATKLYGKVSRKDDIYNLNKAAIGPDENKLKVGMILKLPDAPLAASR